MPEAPVEAVVVEEPGQELAPTQSATLFRTDEPALVLERAQQTAEALMPVVRAQGLIANIQGKEHLTVEAWQTLGAMLGVTPICVWTHPLDDGWEARVEARTLDGRVIGAAEAECLRSESTWKGRDDYALRSMAQTRATSKALASVLRFVATLAGFSGTPAEEVPRDGKAHDGGGRVTKKQATYIKRLLTGSPISVDARQKFNEWAPQGLTQSAASKLIETLKEDSEKGADLAARIAGYSDVPVDDEDLPTVDEALADTKANAEDEIPF